MLASTPLTRQSLDEWDQAFPANKLLASATLDRMRHNAFRGYTAKQERRSPRYTTRLDEIPTLRA